MKRLFAAVLTACLLAGCSSSAGTSASSSQTAGEVKFANPGTYSATAAGRNGEIKVTAEFSENESLSIETESQETENIGARRLYTIMEILLEDISYNLPDPEMTEVIIDREYVLDKLGEKIKEVDVDRYIL